MYFLFADIYMKKKILVLVPAAPLSAWLR